MLKAINSDVSASQIVPIDAATATPEQKQRWVHQTFENISQDYDLMNDVESFGLHRGWKRQLVNCICVHEPKRVLDVACGTGDIALAIAAKLPASHVTGFDFSANMLDVARKRAAELGEGAAAVGVGDLGQEAAGAGEFGQEAAERGNVQFVEGNAMSLPFDDASFDAVSISFGLRNMANYRTSLSEMARVLRPGGCFCCLEASYPTNPIVKPVFKLYFKHIMPWIAHVITKKSAEYQWLNDSTEAFLSKPQLTQLMTECGFEQVKFHSFALGAAALHIAMRG